MIYNTIFDNKNNQGYKLALKTKNKNITYEMLERDIRGFANYLLKKGIHQGDRVLLLLNNRTEFIITYFATVLIGGVIVLVDTKFNQEINEIIETNKIKLIVTDKEREEKVPYITKIKRIIVDEEGVFFTGEADENLTNYLQSNKFKEDDLAVILYTSGSTSRPKGVLNSHRNIEESLKNYTATLPLNSDDIFIGVTPFFHSYCMGSCMLVALYLGATLLLADRFIPRQVLKMIQNNKATVFHGVPFMYKILSEQARNYNLSSLRLCISAGSQLDEKILNDFYNATYKVIHQEYGSSETGTIAVNLSDDLECATKYVGKPLKNVDIELVPIEGAKMTVSKIKSKAIAQGYVNGETFDGKGYLTQDLCEIIDGYICIKGRQNRFINITGLKVNPMEVEECLKSHPSISDAFVRGVKSECLGDIVEALVVKRGCTLMSKDVIDFCKQRLASYKIPTIITWVDEIEKSGMGKSIPVKSV